MFLLYYLYKLYYHYYRNHLQNTKSKMFFNQSSDDIAILNHDNLDVLEETEGIASIKKYFSSRT